MADYWSTFAADRCVPLLNAFVRGEPLNWRLQNLTSAFEHHPDCPRMSGPKFSRFESTGLPRLGHHAEKVP